MQECKPTSNDMIFVYGFSLHDQLVGVSDIAIYKKTPEASPQLIYMYIQHPSQNLQYKKPRII